MDYITQQAQQRGMWATIVRPTAYFKDLTDWPWGAVKDKGSITILGSGSTKINPVDGADLADWIVRHVVLQQGGEGSVAEGASERSGLVRQYTVGGPQVRTQGCC